MIYERLRFDRFGLDALRLEETGTARDAAGHAVVRVKAAGLNPSDLTNVKGGFSQTKLPRTPGRDYAGLVEEGPKEWIGAEVWGSGAELGFTADGTHADYVVVPAASLSRKPANLAFAAAAAAGVPFLAAYIALIETAGLREGETALITGSGRIGGPRGVPISEMAKGARNRRGSRGGRDPWHGSDRFERRRSCGGSRSYRMAGVWMYASMQ